MACADAPVVDRLIQHGPESLTDAELLALLLRQRSGRRQETTAEMATEKTAETAAELLAAAGGVDRLIKTETGVLCARGLPETAAATLAAARELVQRALLADASRAPLGHPAKVVRYVLARHGTPDQEVFGALYLDSRHCLIAERVLFRGTLGCSAVEPRQILRGAVHHQATGLVVWHTHPSTNLTPSVDDVRFTRRLAAACELVGVRLVDHLIVGGVGRWRSIKP
jgi:DNA repair protein RadC